MKKIINLGIICPRTYQLGGCDNNDIDRQKIREYISDVLEFYTEKGYKVIGYAGTTIGVEQDFLNILKNKGLTYYCYQSFENQETVWNHGFDAQQYKILLENAENVEILNDGNYAPKKILFKKKFILHNCDAIIYIMSRKLHKSMLPLCKLKRQHIHFLVV